MKINQEEFYGELRQTQKDLEVQIACVTVPDGKVEIIWHPYVEEYTILSPDLTAGAHSLRTAIGIYAREVKHYTEEVNNT